MSSQQVVVQVIYPPSAASSFDMDYYLNSHVPKVEKLWGPQGLQSCTVITGEKDSGYHVQTSMVWKNMVSFKNAEDVDAVREDIKNFTEVAPYRWVGLVAPQGKA